MSRNLNELKGYTKNIQGNQPARTFDGGGVNTVSYLKKKNPNQYIR